jgi:putative endonuclease
VTALRGRDAAISELEMGKQGFVYILTNKTNTVLYTGGTSDLAKRMYQHKNSLLPGFASKYNADKLVYYDVSEDINDAIAREKQIKAGPRRKKIALINSMNPDWRDLSEEWG